MPGTPRTETAALSPAIHANIQRYLENQRGGGLQQNMAARPESWTAIVDPDGDPIDEMVPRRCSTTELAEPTADPEVPTTPKTKG